MNRDDMRQHLAEAREGRTVEDADAFLEDFIDAVIRSVAAGEKVTIHGLGVFERAARAPRTGRNPHTGDPVPIPATVTPKFRPASAFKRFVAYPSTIPTRTLGRRSPVSK